jgi:hypothetical protein
MGRELKLAGDVYRVKGEAEGARGTGGEGEGEG